MIDIRTEDDEADSVRVTLARPRSRNAISLAMWGGLREVFARLAGERRVRAVLLAGEGDHFSAGADITEFRRERGDAAAGARYSQAVEQCVRALAGLPQPSIAAVGGFCLGGGCSLAMACDFRVAGHDAVFGIPAAHLGIVYGATDTRHLAALVGVPRARRMLYLAERVDATRAAAWGLVDELVPDAPIAAARALAVRLHACAPLSVAGAKRTLATLLDGDRDGGLADMQRAALESEDYREGVRAFLERRKPLFTGA